MSDIVLDALQSKITHHEALLNATIIIVNSLMADIDQLTARIVALEAAASKDISNG